MDSTKLPNWLIVIGVITASVAPTITYRLGQGYERKHMNHPKEFYNWEEEGWTKDSIDDYWNGQEEE